MNQPLHTPADIAALLIGARYFWSTEYDLQDSVQTVLEQANHTVLREHILGAAGRIDFYLPGPRIGIEVKVKGQLTPLLRQAARYARHPDVDGLVIASTVARHRAAPPTLFDVPVAVAPLIGDLA